MTQPSLWTTHTAPAPDIPGTPRFPAIPVAEIDGNQPGPTWLFTAGVHGDEYEGPEAIRRAIITLAGTRFPGRVIALPVTNPMAYAAGVRCTPADGGNLNRLFPGDPRGNLTQRWAHHLWTTFMSRADRLVDLHAGGATWKFEPVAGFYRDEDGPLAAVLGLTMWRAPDAPGVLSYEFRQRRGRAIGAELGFGGTRDEALTIKAAEALVRLARGETAPIDRPVYRHHDVLCEADGEWIAHRDLTEPVSRGDVLGVIHDWTGQRMAEVHSPLDGRVLAVRRLLSVRKGDLVAVVGTTGERN